MHELEEQEGNSGGVEHVSCRAQNVSDLVEHQILVEVWVLGWNSGFQDFRKKWKIGTFGEFWIGITEGSGPESGSSVHPPVEIPENGSFCRNATFSY